MDDKTEKKLQELISRAAKDDLIAIKQIKALNSEDRENFTHLFTLNYLLSRSSHFRGKVIDIAIFLEMVLSKILSKYFTEKNELKENLLNSFVFDRMMISTKLNLLKRIIKTQYPTVWDSYKQDIKEIDELLNFRNNIAHSLLNTSDDYIKSVIKKTTGVEGQKSLDSLDEIEIVYFEENNLKTELITKVQIDEYYTRFYKKIEVLQEIESKLILHT